MLILAATPIGNLGDVTVRLAEALRQADQVFAEDTRQSRKLLNHLGIQKPMSAFHEHSEAKVQVQIAELLEQGKTLVYLSDAGTPGISDPGFELVRLAHRLGVAVDALPGPCSVINALVLAGLPTHEFCFLGFFPTKTAKREALLSRLTALQMTAVLFESPLRIRTTLEFLALHLPDTELALCREMTKIHQQVLRGKPASVSRDLAREKGEFVLVIAPVSDLAQTADPETRYRQLIDGGLPPARAAKTVAKEFRISKREIYARFQIGDG